MLRGRNRAPLLLRSLDIENYEGCLGINERIYISHDIERFSLKLFCFSQRQNLLQVNARTEGYWQVSLRSWRYCLGARLKFWRRSCDLKKGVGTRRLNFYFSRLTPPHLTRLLHNTASYTGYWQVEHPNLMSFGGSSEFKTFPS